MILYNTLSRKKEELRPLKDNTVRIYSCGPTVYSYATIGNLRAYIFADILKKTIELSGFKVFDVMNITDVGHLVSDADEGEDKVEAAARKANTTPQEIARKCTEQFFADCEKLNIRRPKVVAPVTDYIQEMIDFIKGLENKGFTYTTSDGVYFDSSQFPEYNKLSKVSIENNIAGARVDIGEKRNPHDFALWKFLKENAMQKWESPWSRWGCPGWHIECSAVALKELGETFDIHTGGIDAIPIHHTNEIAQTESLTGKPMCTFFCHNEFMTIDGGKMSKSLGNAYTLSDLIERGFSPMAFRYFVLLAGYRSILNFTFEALTSAQNAYNNLVAGLANHFNTPDAKPEADYFKEFKGEITNDLNTPKGIAVLWSALKDKPSKQIYEAIIKMDKTLSLDLERAVADYLKPTQIPDEVKTLAESRLTAKQNKNWAGADKLRSQIKDLGWEILDTKDGYALKKG